MHLVLTFEIVLFVPLANENGFGCIDLGLLFFVLIPINAMTTVSPFHLRATHTFG